jgi:DNA-binding NtrC family response regulator
MKIHEKKTILIADDEYKDQQWDIRFHKYIPDFNFIWTNESKEIFNLLIKHPEIKLLVLDLKFKGQDLQGIDILKKLKTSNFKDLPIIIFTVDDSPKSYLEVSKIAKIRDYIVKYKLNFDDASEIFFDAIENEQNPYDLKGNSGNIRDIKRKIRLFTKSDQVTDSPTVLILGDTGTGKELVAKSIHRMSPLRKNKPFEARNIAELPPDLVASELFGHKAGSFTGANNDKKGAFELAKGGVLFLDEIGELPSYLQVKLLRVLQEKKIYPVGSEKYINVSDVRIIAATNIDIPQSLASGQFRKDLFYRLFGCRIELKSLNERIEDIDILVKYFILKYHHFNKNIEDIDQEVLQKMKNYYWEGNVRQLEKMIESAMILSMEDEKTSLGIESFPDLQKPFIISSQVEIDVFRNNMKKLAKTIWSDIINGRSSIMTLDEIDKQYPESIGYMVGIEAVKHFGGWLSQDQEQKYFGYQPSKSITSRHFVQYFRRRNVKTEQEILKK